GCILRGPSSSLRVGSRFILKATVEGSKLGHRGLPVPLVHLLAFLDRVTQVDPCPLLRDDALTVVVELGHSIRLSSERRGSRVAPQCFHAVRLLRDRAVGD